MKLVTAAALYLIVCYTVSAQETNSCVAVYGPNVQRIEYASSENATYNFVARNACSSSNRNITGAFDSQTTTLINSVPVVSQMMGRLGVSSNKAFCDARTDVSTSMNASESLLIEPLEAAYRNFNECMAILTRGRAEITHVVGSPRLVSIFIRLSDADQRLEIQGVDTTGGFTCATVSRGWFSSGALAPDTPVTLSRNETIKCTRKPSSYPVGGFEYPPGVILVNTSVGTYTVRVPDDTIFGPATKREAARRLAVADASLTRQQAVAAAEKFRADGVRIESHPFYFGASQQSGWSGSFAGKWYGCGDWTDPTTPQRWNTKVPAEICPNADKTSITHVFTHSGGACGFNYYTLACLYYPKIKK